LLLDILYFIYISINYLFQFLDLLFFIVILLVFVVGYAITAHSILYPNTILNARTVLKVFKNAYWNLYGELFLEEY